jgi:DNA-directed RNA polymerase specialized sigma54-like protein|tara:strand:- start:1100 stop:1393 length:294 start_codon:yes stop_codon:yes gene_type:complete
MAINVETNLNYDIKVLEKNVADLQEQLQKSYIRNSELIEQNNALKKERDAMMHHSLSADEIKRKENKNKKSLTSYVEDAMNCNIKTFQNILGKLKGV